MLTTLAYTLLALSGITAAQPLGAQHVHHQHQKRGSEVATPIETVVATPAERVYQKREAAAVIATGVAATPAKRDYQKREAAAAIDTVIVTVTQGAIPTTLQTVATSSTEAAAQSYVASSSSAAAASASSSSSGSSSSSSSYEEGTVEYYAGQGKGITYSPYTDSGSCKSESTIQSDIKELSDFDIIRVYAPDCSCVSAIMGSMGSNQKIFAGLYYMDSLSTDINTLATQVKASSQGWDGIYAVAVGNEWVNSGTYSASEVASAVSSGRSELQNQGYSGSVVTVDTIPAYENNNELCEATDFIAANSHAYWDGNVDASDAGSWLQEQISNVKSACGGSKSVLITETGWPTKGDTYGSKGVPSSANQLACIKSIAETVPDQVIFFTAFNDLWKQPGSENCEQYWGIFD